MCIKLKIIGFRTQLIEMRKVSIENEKVVSSNDEINQEEIARTSPETTIISKKSYNKYERNVRSLGSLHFSVCHTGPYKFKKNNMVGASSKCYFIKENDKV